MESKHKTEVHHLIILDKSESMETIADAAISGLNETLDEIRSAQKQHADTEKHLVSLMTFCASSTDYIYRCTPAEYVKDLTPDSYKPSGLTPLYDAMGRALDELEAATRDMDWKTSVKVTIISDGKDDVSTLHTGQSIKKRIDALRSSKGWEFAYIGLSKESTPAKDNDKVSALDRVARKGIGVLDMVIAFDTTGSMSQYIEAVRNEVVDLIPKLFSSNKDLRLGIVAFGDYCDMTAPDVFGDAYQCLMPTDDEQEIIDFVNNSHNTFGGDSDEFYELVIKKIVDETPWREGSTRSILLISDANPHPLGYTCGEYVTGNQIEWRREAKKAAEKGIKIDTVSITDAKWYKELSDITGGVHLPFSNGKKTARLVEATTFARGSMEARKMFDEAACVYAEDPEMSAVYASLNCERNDY